MTYSWRVCFLALGIGLFSFVGHGETAAVADLPQIINWPDLERALNLSAYKNKKMNRKVRVAILDNGFNGYESLAGTLLPKNIKDNYHHGESEADKIPAAQSYHGTLMAVAVAQVIARSGVQADYDLHLFNTFGYTKFKNAVARVASEGFDIVLYSQVWELGGNGDGRGFINGFVNQATKEGVIWINAAGNFARLTRRVSVDGKAEPDGEFVVFKKRDGQTAKGAEIHCKIVKGKKCRARIVMAWNDFKDDGEAGTDKDLDLILLNAKGEVVARGDRRQKLEKDLADPKASQIPRELLELDLEPGSYTVRAQVISKNFSPARDWVRITLTGLALEMSDPDGDETLLPPADNTSVIVVGASDDFQSSGSKASGVPKIHLPSAIKFKDGSTSIGASMAAAFATGLAVIGVGTGAMEKNASDVETKLIALAKSLKARQIKDPARAAAKVRPPPRSARRAIRPNVRGQTPPGPAPAPADGWQYAVPSPRGMRTPAPLYQTAETPCLPANAVRIRGAAIQRLISAGFAAASVYRGTPVLLVDDTRVALPRVFPNQFLFQGPSGFVTFTVWDVLDGRVPGGYYQVVRARLAYCGL